MMTPMRQPMKTVSTTMTIRSASPKLTRKSRTAVATMSDCQWIRCSSMPIGMPGSSSRTRASIARPTSTLLTVVSQKRARRIDIALAHRADVADLDKLIAAVTGRSLGRCLVLHRVENRGSNEEVADVFRRLEVARRRDAHAHALDVEIAAVDHQILRLEGRLEALLADTELGQLRL